MLKNGLKSPNLFNRTFRGVILRKHTIIKPQVKRKKSQRLTLKSETLQTIIIDKIKILKTG